MPSAELSIDSAAANNNGPPWRNNHSTPDNRGSNDHRAAAGGDAACPIHTARADDGARVDRAQGDEASCQQYRDDQMFHEFSPWVVT
jgi:hypothetical protein